MLINEVSEATGLSKKAIRFYEEKGLVSTERTTSGYRVYSDECVERLRQIKLLRLAGVSVADIKLLFGEVITVSELVSKRREELRREYGRNSEQYAGCSALLSKYKDQIFEVSGEFDENDTSTAPKDGRFIMGLDIGTTSISAVIIDVDTKLQAEHYTVRHGADVEGLPEIFAEQSVTLILDRVTRLATNMMSTYPGICAIGVTGQMHGIVYLDGEGTALSNLMTWQDKRGDAAFTEDDSYSGYMRRVTGESVSAGFGLVTHFYNLKNGIVPEGTVSFCSIMDYVVMRLTERKSPLVHTSVAASFGLFDIRGGAFKKDIIHGLGITDVILPEVTGDFSVAGHFKGVPVAVAIGDNQASFMGSVRDLDRGLLLNLGTGGQICAVTTPESVPADAELRPLVGDRFIACGASLGGGASYALLERFFSAYLYGATGNEAPQYNTMNRLAEEALEKGLAPVDVDTLFWGQRKCPAVRGRISGITPENFTPGQLILGFIYGMCRELRDYFAVDEASEKELLCRGEIIASGNAVQKIHVMTDVIGDVFSLPVRISENKEEAATGTALFAAVSAGVIEEISGISEYIRYRS